MIPVVTGMTELRMPCFHPASLSAANVCKELDRMYGEQRGYCYRKTRSGEVRISAKGETLSWAVKKPRVAVFGAPQNVDKSA